MPALQLQRPESSAMSAPAVPLQDKPLTRADRRRFAKGVAKAVQHDPRTNRNAPMSLPCGKCSTPTYRREFDTSAMASMLWHKIAPSGWMYRCSVCGHTAHIVEGMHPVDDVWIQAQMAAQQSPEDVEIRVVVSLPGRREQTVFLHKLRGQGKRSSGLVVARA